MRPSADRSGLKSQSSLLKQSKLQIRIDHTLELANNLSSSSYQRKRLFREKNHHTEASSPTDRQKQAPSFLPQLQTTKSILRLSNGRPNKTTCSKTVEFLDSLLNILKDDGVSSDNRERKHRQASSFSKAEAKRMKKPKILKNDLTKIFCQHKVYNRNILSEQSHRKFKESLTQQFTFYGKLKEIVKVRDMGNGRRLIQ